MHRFLARQADIKQLHVCCMQNAGAHGYVLECIASANMGGEKASSMLHDCVQVWEKNRLHCVLHHCAGGDVK